MDTQLVLVDQQSALICQQVHRNVHILIIRNYKALEAFLIEIVIKKEDPKKQYFWSAFPEPQRASISQDMVFLPLQILDKM